MCGDLSNCSSASGGAPAGIELNGATSRHKGARGRARAWAAGGRLVEFLTLAYMMTRYAKICKKAGPGIAASRYLGSTWGAALYGRSIAG
jgi:hypothetical protein